MLSSVIIATLAQRAAEMGDDQWSGVVLALVVVVFVGVASIVLIWNLAKGD